MTQDPGANAPRERGSLFEIVRWEPKAMVRRALRRRFRHLLALRRGAVER